MTHYRMSFDDWLDQCRAGVLADDRHEGWIIRGLADHIVGHELAADYVRDCIANQTVRDIDGPLS